MFHALTLSPNGSLCLWRVVVSPAVFIVVSPILVALSSFAQCYSLGGCLPCPCIYRASPYTTHLRMVADFTNLSVHITSKFLFLSVSNVPRVQLQRCYRKCG